MYTLNFPLYQYTRQRIRQSDTFLLALSIYSNSELDYISPLCTLSHLDIHHYVGSAALIMCA